MRSHDGPGIDLLQSLPLLNVRDPYGWDLASTHNGGKRCCEGSDKDTGLLEAGFKVFIRNTNATYFGLSDNSSGMHGDMSGICHQEVDNRTRMEHLLSQLVSIIRARDCQEKKGSKSDKMIGSLWFVDRTRFGSKPLCILIHRSLAVAFPSHWSRGFGTLSYRVSGYPPTLSFQEQDRGSSL